MINHFSKAAEGWVSANPTSSFKNLAEEEGSDQSVLAVIGQSLPPPLPYLQLPQPYIPHCNKYYFVLPIALENLLKVLYKIFSRFEYQVLND